VLDQRTPSRERRRTGVPAVALWTAVAACWAVLLLGTLAGGEGAHGHHHAAGYSWDALPLLAGSWLLMVGAMMLPSTVPMVRMFLVVSARQPRPAPARAAFLGGYLAVWAGFGLLALSVAIGLRVAADSLPWLDVGPRWTLAGVLALAGGFQFSKLKRSCLTQCRDPRAFLYQHYRRGARGGWELGLRHGLSCLGCCWALMLVMVAAGAAALPVMVALTAVMVAEKNTRWGARMATPVAVLLLVAAAAVALGVVPTGGEQMSHVMVDR
jgi:predicted metal-binding membrane protein